MIPALLIVSGFFFALAALAFIGDRLTDRHVATAQRLPHDSGQLVPGVDDWLDLTPPFIGGRHATRTAVALARSSRPTNNDAAERELSAPRTTGDTPDVAINNK